MSVAGPPQGTRPPGGERRDAPVGGGSNHAAGPPGDRRADPRSPGPLGREGAERASGGSHPDPRPLGEERRAAPLGRGHDAPIALLGGTFDPVHNGHLHLAADVRAALALPEVRLVPAADPPHRPAPGAAAVDRLAMARLAVTGLAGLAVDAREIERGGASFTVDTLQDFRREAPARPLAWIVGADAFLGLPSWRRWTELFDLAHFIVVARPGVSLDGTLPPELAEQWRLRLSPGSTLATQLAGSIVSVEIAPHAISASMIRAELARGRARDVGSRGLLPAAVLAYIEQHRLYGTR